MPYIKKEYREPLDPSISTILSRWYHMSKQDVAGEFTYVVYSLLSFFSGKFWMRALGLGCVLCAILEIYRRDHGPYEDNKILENGDVYANYIDCDYYCVLAPPDPNLTQDGISAS